jgi:hypothetical protein
MEGKSTAF